MRLPRRRPLLLVAVLTLTLCGWAAWKINEQTRPIEEAYAKIGPGMTLSEARSLLTEAGAKEEWCADPSRYPQDHRFFFRGEYVICLFFGQPIPGTFPDDLHFPQMS